MFRKIINFSILNLFQFLELSSIQIVFILDFFFSILDRQLHLQIVTVLFISYFPVFTLLISFSCHSALANIANMVLNNSSGRRILVLVLILKKMLLTVYHEYNIYYILWWICFTPGFLRVLKFLICFGQECCCISSNTLKFFLPKEMTIWFYFNRV